MAKLTRLGELERAVMDCLWSTPEPQTVRQVHEALSAQRELAYTTIMTVLQRLAKNGPPADDARGAVQRCSGSCVSRLILDIPQNRGGMDYEE
jgi:predicted transcriptional regulator